MSLEVATLAQTIAVEYHAGQKYGSSNRDFVDAHLRPAVRMVRRLGYGPLFEAVLWLHDGLEQTSLTRGEMRRRGIPIVVAEPVDLMTKREGEAHCDYIARVASNPFSVVGKVVDSSVNFANNALGDPAEKSDDKFVIHFDEYLGNLVLLRPLMPPPEEANLIAA